MASPAANHDREPNKLDPEIDSPMGVSSINAGKCTKTVMEFAEVLVKSEVSDHEFDAQPQPLVTKKQIKTEPDVTFCNNKIKTELLEPSFEISIFNNANNQGYVKKEAPVMLEVNIDPILYPSLEEEEDQISKDGFTKINDRFHCSYCTRHYARKAYVKKHVQIHKEKLIEKQCHICFQQFKSRKIRDEHVAGHTDARPYQCDSCHKTFRAKKHVKKHITKDFCARQVDLTCNVCGKVFPYSSLYKSHMVKHETEKPFKCEVCNMHFKHRSAVTRHMLQHTGVKNFACTLCEKRFYLKGLLKTHMKSHSSERPFVCQICQKGFSLKHNLKKHQVVHSKPKKLTCDVCQKKFPRESRLKYHMQVHSREKKFACDLCNRFFSHKHNVVRHLAARHEEVLNPSFVASLKF